MHICVTTQSFGAFSLRRDAFSCHPIHPSKDLVISEYTFREKDSHDLLGETIVIIFAELAKRNNYEKDMYDEKRRKGELAAATEAGIAQGIEKGIELMAKNMLAAGFPHDQIAQLTGLDSDTIQSLASTISDIS